MTNEQMQRRKNEVTHKELSELTRTVAELTTQLVQNELKYQRDVISELKSTTIEISRKVQGSVDSMVRLTSDFNALQGILSERHNSNKSQFQRIWAVIGITMSALIALAIKILVTGSP